jgi:inhibitor of the pro-sigma K processing machinery
MVIQYVMWGLFIFSSMMLIYLWFRKGQAARWLSILGMNLLIAVILLFIVNWIGTYTHFTIPYNYLTVSVVTLLGVPGLILLTGLKIALL